MRTLMSKHPGQPYNNHLILIGLSTQKHTKNKWLMLTAFWSFSLTYLEMRTRLCSTAFDFDWDIFGNVLNLEHSTALVSLFFFCSLLIRLFWMYDSNLYTYTICVYIFGFFSSGVNAYDSIVSLALNAIRLCSKWANVKNIEKSNDYVVLHMYIISKPKKCVLTVTRDRIDMHYIATPVTIMTQITIQRSTNSTNTRLYRNKFAGFFEI